MFKEHPEQPNLSENLRNNILPREFYLQDTFQCLRNCLGKIIVTNVGNSLTAGRIVEAEAYVGAIDKASHSYNGRRTPRTEIQFGLGGHAYIFSVHTYNQFCFVTGDESKTDVILIRGIEPVEGITTMETRRRKALSKKELGNGPGKLCISLGIDKSMYGEDLTSSSRIWLIDDEYGVLDTSITKTTRIGIDYAEEYKDMNWRYYIKNSEYVSKK